MLQGQDLGPWEQAQKLVPLGVLVRGDVESKKNSGGRLFADGWPAVEIFVPLNCFCMAHPALGAWGRVSGWQVHDIDFFGR